MIDLEDRRRSEDGKVEDRRGEEERRREEGSPAQSRRFYGTGSSVQSLHYLQC